MPKTKIGIVGVGPRGTSLLERIITYCVHCKLARIPKLLLFDKNSEFGVGCHGTDIAENLLLNTIADQITMYFGEKMKPYGPVYDGKNLYEWAVEHHYKAEKIAYLPRKILGDYLKQFYNEQIQRMNKYEIDFEEIRKEVTNIICLENEILIHLKNKEYSVKKAVLALGHHGDVAVNCVHRGQTVDMAVLKTMKVKSVAIQGMGLTAFDVISDLTEGLGGQFERTNSGGLNYIPSGKEPVLYPYSRTGIFLSGRAFNRDTEFIYQPVYFTFKEIKKLKTKKGRLNFLKDVIPLLNKELVHAYKLQTGKDDFDVDKFWHPENELDISSQEDLKNSFYRCLTTDIIECRKGKFESPIKFCQDIVRDVRDVIRYAVEYDGLDINSYEKFINEWQPVFNRICVGPPCIRLEQLRALIDSGICDLKHVKKPNLKTFNDKYILKNVYKDGKKEFTIFECLIKAKIKSTDYEMNKNIMIVNIKKRYIIFKKGKFYRGGLKVTKNHNLMDKNNRTCKNLYALGVPTEGSKYFTFVLGRPNMVSTFLKDNNRVARSLMKTLVESKNA